LLLVGLFVALLMVCLLVILGSSSKIIYDDMAKPDPLLRLCEGVVMARMEGNLETEGRLYFVLIDVLRSTEVLKLITRPAIEAYEPIKFK
jgi:hypothetical protein